MLLDRVFWNFFLIPIKIQRGIPQSISDSICNSANSSHMHAHAVDLTYFQSVLVKCRAEQNSIIRSVLEPKVPLDQILLNFRQFCLFLDAYKTSDKGAENLQ